MKTLYIDCGMGAAGDMLSGALLEILPDQEGTLKELNAMGIPGVIYKQRIVEKCGVRGTAFEVTVYDEEEVADIPMTPKKNGHHHGHDEVHGNTLVKIEGIVKKIKVDQDIKNEVLAIYKMLADAESQVHGEAVDLIHFHEVGAMDAIADITAFCYMLKKLAPDRIIASPVHVGTGQVKCSHGILPVPAPATALILKGIPIYSSIIKGELCTPTGAALLKHFVDKFDDMPLMRTTAIGYGMGKKDFDRANCVRMMLGEGENSFGGANFSSSTKETISVKDATKNEQDDIAELICNIDDMSAEEIGFASDKIMTAGALDVFTVSIGMKKFRPGTELHVLCTVADKDNMVAMLFGLTSTLGIRETLYHRYILNRNIEIIDTPCGEVRKKIADGYGVIRTKYEYEDLAWIANERKVSLAEARKLVDAWSLEAKKKK